MFDVRLAGRSGLDLRRELTTADTQLPIIFIAGRNRASSFPDLARIAEKLILVWENTSSRNAVV